MDLMCHTEQFISFFSRELSSNMQNGLLEDFLSFFGSAIFANLNGTCRNIHVRKPFRRKLLSSGDKQPGEICLELHCNENWCVF